MSPQLGEFCSFQMLYVEGLLRVSVPFILFSGYTSADIVVPSLTYSWAHVARRRSQVKTRLHAPEMFDL